MKKEKSLKALENSENHSKGKSTNANTTINDKLKYNKLKKISDIPSIKRSKKLFYTLILIMKLIHYPDIDQIKN